MKKENLFMALFVILITIFIVLLCVAPVFAQDEMPPEEEPIEEPIDEPVEEEPVEVDPGEGIEAPLGDCIGNGCGEPIVFEIYGCVKYPLAENYLDPISWEGWIRIDDGSCFCMDYSDDLGAYEVPCHESNGSFIQMLIDEGIIEKMPWMPDIIHPKFVEPESEIIADYVEGAEDTILVGDYDFGEPLSMEWVE